LGASPLEKLKRTQNERKMSVIAALPPRRILVRSTNWLGDAVMTTPALQRLREKFPEARITLFCPEKLTDLWRGLAGENHPSVNEVIPFAPQENLLTAAGTLRAGKFDLALVLPNSPRSALEVFLAGIPRRVGYSRPWRNFFLTQAVPPYPRAMPMRKRSPEEIKRLIVQDPSAGNTRPKIPLAAHHIHEYLNLAAALGANPEPVAPQLFISPKETGAAREKFGLKDTAQPVFGLNPGAEYGPAKRWPAEKFIAAAREIQRQTNCLWLIFGGPSDAKTAAAIAAAISPSPSAVRNLSAQTSLRELMALLKLCRVLLTNDTGPMHVAAALGTPVVVPFGSTSPELTGPGLPGDPHHALLKSDVPCSPCFLRECPIDFRCLNGLSAERVVAAFLQINR
jgi:heptosyltransferase-2